MGSSSVCQGYGGTRRRHCTVKLLGENSHPASFLAKSTSDSKERRDDAFASSGGVWCRYGRQSLPRGGCRSPSHVSHRDSLGTTLAVKKRAIQE